MRTLMTSSGYNKYTKGWIDLDRQWVNGMDEPSQTGTEICKLKDYLVTTRIGMSDTWQMEVTKDGCIHKRTSFSDGRYSIRRFGENKMIVFWMPSSRPTSTLNMNTYEIDEFSVDSLEITRRNSLLVVDKRYFDYYYFGHLPNGCMVYFQNGNIGDLYKIEQNTDNSLIVTFLYNDEPQRTGKPRLIGSSITRSLLFNGKYYCINAYSEGVKVESQTLYMKEVVVQYSANCSDWEIIRIRLTTEATNSATPQTHMCIRNGRLFVYVFNTLNGIAYTTQVFEIVGDEAVEIPLLTDVITVPVKSNVGKGTLKNAPIEYIQIQLDSNAETTELSWHLKDIMNNDIADRWGSVEFKDGEIQDQVEEPFLMLNRVYGGNRYIYIYLDAELKPNIDNFAFISSSFADSDGQEKLMDGDYCYRGTDKTESEVL